ncbi:MAG: hypothetical protein GY826_08360 [Fuerstiella sp.]|nr:hypothetical protein [Fuerstiella sp.]
MLATVGELLVFPLVGVGRNRSPGLPITKEAWMPTTLPRWLTKPATKFYKRTILKDPFLASVKQWKRDRGDTTLR